MKLNIWLHIDVNWCLLAFAGDRSTVDAVAVFFPTFWDMYISAFTAGLAKFIYKRPTIKDGTGMICVGIAH